MSDSDFEKRHQMLCDLFGAQIVDDNTRLAEGVNRLRRQLNRAEKIMGPDYEVLWERSDGEVLATSMERLRKAWIRTFSCHAFGAVWPNPSEVNLYPNGLSAELECIVDSAIELWEILEARFENEQSVKQEVKEDE